MSDLPMLEKRMGPVRLAKARAAFLSEDDDEYAETLPEVVAGLGFDPAPRRKRKMKMKYPAKRKFALRSDSTVGAACATIQKLLKLPPGSIRLALPSGRVARSDKRIGALLKDYGW